MPDQPSAIALEVTKRGEPRNRFATPMEPPATRTPEAVERAEQRRMFILTATCLTAMLLGWGASGLGLLPGAGVLALYILAYLTGGWYPVLGTVTALRQRTLDVNLLMVLAALGAAAVNQWREGAILMFLFSLRACVRSSLSGCTVSE